MFVKNIAKKITMVIATAALTIASVVPTFAYDSVEILNYTQKVSVNEESNIILYPMAGEWYQLFNSNNIDDILSRSYVGNQETELIGLALASMSGIYSADAADNYNVSFNVKGVKKGDNVKIISWQSVPTAGIHPALTAKDVDVYDTKVEQDEKVDAVLGKSALRYSVLAFVRLSEVEDELSKIEEVAGSPAIIKDSAGNSVNIADVKSITKALDTANIASAKEKIAAQQNVTITNENNVDYFDISLKDVSGNTVILENGQLQVTVPAKSGMTSDRYIVKVYHIKADGTVEKVDAELTSAGVKITATSFSPYIIVYEAKTSSGNLNPGGGSESEPDNDPAIAETKAPSSTSNSTVANNTSNTTTANTAPKTGDAAPIAMLAFVIMAAGVICITAIRKKSAK